MKTLEKKRCTVASFGIVVTRDKDGVYGVVLIRDKPKKEGWESFYKYPGGCCTGGIIEKVFEETGLDVDYWVERPFFTYRVPDGSHISYFYLLKKIGGALVRGENVDEVKFFSFTRLDELFREKQILLKHSFATRRFLNFVFYAFDEKSLFKWKIFSEFVEFG